MGIVYSGVWHFYLPLDIIMQENNIGTIVQQIKNMNNVFERLEWIGVSWDNEFAYFEEEMTELVHEWIKETSLIGSLDALVDICVFAVGALHKSGMTTEQIVGAVSTAQIIDIWDVQDVARYQDQCINILFTVLRSMTTFVGEHKVVDLFHEVYLSNMSKLKDGKPVPGNLPGKFGKNLETYFKPDLAKYLVS